jgi:hypothetical protein
MMAKINKYLVLIFLGGWLGLLGSSYLAPGMIAWYFDPPVSMGINCVSATQWAMSRLQTAQLIGSGLGAIVFMILAVALGVSKKDSTVPSPKQ